MNSRFVLLLHAHLPYVRHPEREVHLEERWLFEAMSETYLPLIRMLRRLDQEDVPVRMAISMSPTLIAMLQDPVLIERYRRHIDRNLLLAEQELDRTVGTDFEPIVEVYLRRLEDDQRDLDDSTSGDLRRVFDYFAKKGIIELLASSATHAFLPHYRQWPEVVAAQVSLGIDTHLKAFGTAPKGFWLPECGYYEGVEKILASAGIDYFVGSAHSVLLGSPVPRSGVYRPVVTKSGVTVFPRDVYSAHWVWSSEDGYPGHPEYRDFYRDIGYDLPFDYIRPFTPDSESRINTGFKYYAVTGDTDDKTVYLPQLGAKRAREHAVDFLNRLTDHGRTIEAQIGGTPVITSSYDAELFGHWWFEGVDWIEHLFREAHSRRQSGQDVPEFTTPAAYMKEHPAQQEVQPSFSSWGSRGYAEVWLDGSNDWVYRHTHKAIERMGELIARFPDETGLKRRALNQAAREVLLSQASDWPFILNAGTVVPYAQERLKEHLFNFARIYEALSRGNIGTDWLTALEKKNAIFPDIDYRVLRLRTLETLQSLT